MKKSRTLLAALATGMLLAGCAGGSSGAFAPVESSIYITRDGGISSALVESYDKNIYVQSELQEFAAKAVEAYNAENPGQASGGKAPVTLKSCTLENGKATVVFDYVSGDDLSKFAKENDDTANQVESLTVSSVADGLVQGSIVDGTFVKAKDGSSVGNENVAKKGDWHLVAVQGPSVTISTEGKVQFVSAGSTIVDDYTVKTPEGKAYIVFK